MKSSTTWRRRLAAVAAAGALALGAFALAGCAGGGTDQKADEPQQQQAAPEMREFTDSLGRTVELPATIERIAPSGHTATQVLLTMAPDKLVGLSQELADYQAAFFGDGIAELPIFGAAFGAKGDMNKEAVAAADPQVIIDTGEPKDGLAEDIDSLQEQLGIPVVFINTPLEGWGDAYRLLGECLGMPERGEELAAWCDNAYQETTDVMAGIPEADRVNMAYLMGDAGLNAIAKGSYQGTVIDMCANNVVEVEKASGQGSGNEISLEQLAVWNPELIVFGATSGTTETLYDTVPADAAWQGIAAIDNDNIFEVPAKPWSWLNNPPTVNQVLGLQWLPRVLYPDQYDDDLKEVVCGYYQTFYGYEMSDAEYDELTAKARPKA